MLDKLPYALLSLAGFAVATAWITDRPWPVYCLYLGVFALGAAYLCGLLVSPRKVIWSPLALIVAAVPLWGVAQISAGWSVNPSQTVNMCLLWASNTVLFFLAMQLSAGADGGRRFRSCLLLGGAALALEAILQLYTADSRVFWLFPSTAQGVIMGPVPYHNHFSALVALVLPIALYGAFWRADKSTFYGLLAAVLAGSVFASESRSGTILVVGELLAALALGFRAPSKSGRGRLRAALVVFVLVAGGVLVAGAGAVWQRYHEPDTVRLSFDQSSLDMIRARPWAGYGLGTWPSVYPMYARFDDGLFANQAHCDWLQWAAEGGLPLAVLLAGFALAISRAALRSGWGIGLIAVFLLALVDYPFQKPAVASIFFMLAGSVLHCGKRRPVSTGYVKKIPSVQA